MRARFLLLFAAACGGGGAAPDAAAPDAAVASDAGAPPDARTLADVVERGEAAVATEPRPAWGALRVVEAGERSHVLESRRDVEPGPFGLGWRSRFRVAAYDGGALAWSFAADADDHLADVAVHPSGDVTVSLQRFPPERLAYELVRLSPGGEVIARQLLAQPATLPDADHGVDDPRPLFRMKSYLTDATTAGWVSLLPDGEGLVAAFLSYVDAPEDDPRSQRYALGVAAFDWDGERFVERWARVVEGTHAAQPAVWAYDELRQREQAIRPFLARDDASGELLVARGFNNTRCQAVRSVFGELTQLDCVLRAVSPIENELVPLVVTRFDAAGRRLGTVILDLDPDAAEQVPFALVARDGKLAVAGMVVRRNPDGGKRTYPDPSGFVDYDGYLAVYDAAGTRLHGRDFNLGRGDLLAGLRWTDAGLVAAGGSGWDRWQGGQSISRGASPLLVWMSADGTRAASRVVPLGGATRHFLLHDVTVRDGAVVGLGFSDAPMTHSADGGNDAARTFGPLRVELR